MLKSQQACLRHKYQLRQITIISEQILQPIKSRFSKELSLKFRNLKCNSFWQATLYFLFYNVNHLELRDQQDHSGTIESG